LYRKAIKRIEKYLMMSVNILAKNTHSADVKQEAFEHNQYESNSSSGSAHFIGPQQYPMIYYANFVPFYLKPTLIDTCTQTDDVINIQKIIKPIPEKLVNNQVLILLNEFCTKLTEFQTLLHSTKIPEKIEQPQKVDLKEKLIARCKKTRHAKLNIKFTFGPSQQRRNIDKLIIRHFLRTYQSVPDGKILEIMQKADVKCKEFIEVSEFLEGLHQIEHPIEHNEKKKNTKFYSKIIDLILHNVNLTRLFRSSLIEKIKLIEQGEKGRINKKNEKMLIATLNDYISFANCILLYSDK